VLGACATSGDNFVKDGQVPSILQNAAQIGLNVLAWSFGWKTVAAPCIMAKSRKGVADNPRKFATH